MTRFSSSQPAILWVQVVILALVQGAISLMWVIYNLYLPLLLVQLGFSKEFAVGLLVVENILAIAMEPLMGTTSDRMQHWLGSKFPIIALGVVVAASLFGLLPLIAAGGSPAGIGRWILPIALVTWALAMTVFRSPVLSLLGQYALTTRLPQAASILTLTGALAAALGNFTNQFLLSLGAMITFIAGSLVLLGATLALRLVKPQSTVHPTARKHSQPRLSRFNLGLIFGAGVGIILGFALLMRSLLNPVPPQPEAPLLLTVFTLVHVLAILPMGWVATQVGNGLAMLIGLGVTSLTVILVLGVYGSLGGVILMVLLGIAWSGVANGTIPFALSLVPPHRAGLGTGMFFAGGALAASVVGLITSRIGPIPRSGGAIAAVVAFALAAVCIGISEKGRSQS